MPEEHVPKEAQSDTYELTDALQVLDPKTFEAVLMPAEGLVVRCPEHGERKRVRAAPCFPVTDWGRYIVFSDEDDNELGIIEDMRDLSAESRRAVAHELDEQHFLPIITRIVSISREFRVPVWVVETDRGERTFSCRGRHAAQRMGGGRYYIRDADGNGYLIPDIGELDVVSRRLIDLNA
jgi:hypothetical protein